MLANGFRFCSLNILSQNLCRRWSFIFCILCFCYRTKSNFKIIPRSVFNANEENVNRDIWPKKKSVLSTNEVKMTTIPVADTDLIWQIGYRPWHNLSTLNRDCYIYKSQSWSRLMYILWLTPSSSILSGLNKAKYWSVTYEQSK